METTKAKVIIENSAKIVNVQGLPKGVIVIDYDEDINLTGLVKQLCELIDIDSKIEYSFEVRDNDENDKHVALIETTLTDIFESFNTSLDDVTQEEAGTGTEEIDSGNEFF